jgi:hypothetical protein
MATKISKKENAGGIANQQIINSEMGLVHGDKQFNQKLYELENCAPQNDE